MARRHLLRGGVPQDREPGDPRFQGSRSSYRVVLTVMVLTVIACIAVMFWVISQAR